MKNFKISMLAMFVAVVFMPFNGFGQCGDPAADAQGNACGTRFPTNGTAIGGNNSATGMLSFAFGGQGFLFPFPGATNSASGDWSVAGGTGSTAGGDYSYAFGDNVMANALHAIVFGANSQANSNYSFAFGNNSFANGDYSLSFGNSLFTLSNHSLAFGDNSSTFGDFSIAFGRNNNVSGLGGSFSFIFGENNEATGDYSLAIGQNAHALEHQSYAFGENVMVNGGAHNSYAFGQGVSIDPGAHNSYIFGDGIISNPNPQSFMVAVGGNNTFEVQPGQADISANTNIFGDLFVASHVGISTPPIGTFALDVAGDIRCNNITTFSDASFKTGITKINNPLSLINRLNGTYFKYVENTERNFPTTRQLGFIAQDVERVIPEVVVTGADGIKSVAYQNLTALLVEGMKEQQVIIENQQAQIDNLESRLSKLEAMMNGNEPKGNILQSKGSLGQNRPNPFGGETVINFELIDANTNASIVVYDLSGRQLKSIAVSGKGHGSVTISANEFAPGVYIYGLVINGELADSKKMVVSGNH